MPSETTPLLNSGLPLSLPVPVTHPRSKLRLKPARIHFLDNLRATLVFCLIFHHAAVNVLQRTALENAEERTKRARAVLAAFTQGNTQILWPTFFLVSGWAARLSLEAKSDNYAFIRKRIFGTLVPAIVYLVIGRWLIVKWIDPAVFMSDSSTSLWTPYAQLTGPAPYILTLVVLDIGNVAVRFFVGKLPAILWRAVDVLLKIILIMAAISLVLHASALHHLHAKLIPGAYYVFFPGDTPGYGAPTTFIVAYMAGANGPFIQKYMLTARQLIALPAVLVSFVFAYFPSPFLAAIRLRFPGFDVFHYAIGFFTVSWSLLSTFTTVPGLHTKWTNSWVQWSWLAAYVHIVPTISTIYALQTPGSSVEDLALRALIAGAAGAAITWPLVAIVAAIWGWTRWIRRRWTFSTTEDTWQDELLQSPSSNPPILYHDNEGSRLPKLHFRPAYVRDFWWGDPSLLAKDTLAVASQTMRALPSVPHNELDNDVANHTLAMYPHLFQVTTPIRASALHDLLVNHPNRPFVDSVHDGLLRGFWPFADTSKTALPYTLDARECISKPAHIKFARQQRENEIASGRFSPSFPTLLPGMMAVPVRVVPKPNPSKLRLVIDHNAVPFSRNQMIDKSRLIVPMDGMHEFGQALLKFREKVGPDEVLVAFKSNVKEAYRLLPMAPHWQMKQIVKIDGTFHVDWRNNFGGRASGTIWGSFFSLVIWIAVFVRQMPDLFTYMDDCYGFDLASNMVWYEPYRKRMPGKQVRLLKLWDELGIPHSAEKQVFGGVLTIIGFEVDVNVMSITLPAASKSDLIRAIQQFAVTGNRHKLSDFQALEKWINWALNVYPLLHPCLSGMHAKMEGQSIASKEMRVDPNIVFELTWAVNHLKSSTCDGVFLTKSQHWTLEDADVVLQTDACMSGMGFVCLDKMSGFQARISDDDVQKHPSVNYWEALAVLSAFHWALHAFTPPPRRIVIYTNNPNVVHLFQSMQTSPEFNLMAMTAADLMLRTSSQLRVVHVPGPRNVVADALSRFTNDAAQEVLPELTIHTFIPPTLIHETRPPSARLKRKAIPLARAHSL